MDRHLKIPRLVILSSLVLLVISSSSFASSEWVQDGIDCSGSLQTEQGPALTSDGSSGTIVVWYRYSAGLYRLIAQRFDHDGNDLWARGGVEIFSDDGSIGLIDVCADGTGGAFIAWRTYDPTTRYNVNAQKIDENGDLLWDPASVVVSAASGDQGTPRIVPDAAGGAIVIWTDAGSGDNDIYGQRIGSNGLNLWAKGGIPITTATDAQTDPDIIIDGSGGAYIVWEDRRGSESDIYGCRINGSGAFYFSELAICDATDWQVTPEIISDNAGGAIVCWTDARGSSADVYAQRINGSGTALWTANGVGAVFTVDEQSNQRCISDGDHGIILVWEDDRNGTDIDIYGQYLDGDGTYQWDSYGLPLCAAAGDQQHIDISSDGNDGIVLAWQDYRNGPDPDIYIQRVDLDGTPLWPADRSGICLATDDQTYVRLMTTTKTVTYATWTDHRDGIYSTYLQRIDDDGFWGWTDPVLGSVEDVHGDEGGRIRLTVEYSDHDKPGTVSNPITGYNLWKKIDPASAPPSGSPEPAASAAGIPGDELLLSLYETITDPLTSKGTVLDGPDAASIGMPPGSWESLGFHMAVQSPEYYYTIYTDADSSGAGIPWETYVVTAHTAVPAIFFASRADSGYSTDDVAPAMPSNLAGDPESTPPGIALTWDLNTEIDLDHYAVYRGATEGFVPGPGNLLGEVSQLHFEDDYRDWHVSYYKVSALDIHGNESEFALLSPDVVTGDGDLPGADYLSGNYPNPFNPSTTITFGLSHASHVKLGIYDAAGRLVSMLIDEDRPAGHYDEVWNGLTSLGRRAVSGVYFCRLSTKTKEMTAKMVLLR